MKFIEELRKHRFAEKDLNQNTAEDGEIITTVNPQAVIKVLGETFGYGNARLEVVDRVPKSIHHGDQVKEVWVSAKVVVDNGLFKWESSVRTKGFKVDPGELIGNAMNAAESMLWLPCVREIGLGGYLYEGNGEEPKKPTVRIPEGKTEDKGQVASADAREAKTDNGEQQDAPEEKTVVPANEETQNVEVHEYIAKLQSIKSGPDAKQYVYKTTGFSEDEIKQIKDAKRLGRNILEDFLSEWIDGKYTKDSQADDVVGEIQEDIFNDEEPDNDSSDSDDGVITIDDLLLPAPKSLEESKAIYMEVKKKTDEIGMNSEVYKNNFIPWAVERTGILEFPEELLTFSKYFTLCTQLWINLIYEYVEEVQ